MSKIDDLHDQRLALMDRVVHELAAERGIDTWEGIPPTERHRLIYDAEVLYEEWFERVQDGEPILPVTPIEMLPGSGLRQSTPIFMKR